MFVRDTLAVVMSAVALLTVPGCAVSRDQQTVGAYIDDTTITDQIKSRFMESKDVAATSISVETLDGVVLLSGYAKNANEKSKAESIAREVKGVKAIRNEVAVMPLE
jgi:hyperosmotically inducible protein